MAQFNQKLRDRLLLLVMGLVCSALALLFWRVANNHGFAVLFTISFAAIFVDNLRLRKKVQALEQQLRDRAN